MSLPEMMVRCSKHIETYSVADFSEKFMRFKSISFDISINLLLVSRYCVHS